MPTSSLPVIPGLHGRFLAERLPDWLRHATPTDFKRWRERQRPAQWAPSGPATWFEWASPEDRQALLDAQQRAKASARALALALKDFQGVGAFAEPLLKAELKSAMDFELDVNTTELVEIYYESAFLGSTQKLRPRKQSLMQAALQNFSADARFEPGSALAPKGSFALELIPAPQGAYPRFQYRYTQKLDIEPERFATLCHELDLGGKYQAHISEIFENPATRDAVRAMSISADKDQLRLAAQTAFMKDEISASAREMLNGLLDGQPAPLFHGKPVTCQSLTMFQSPLAGVLVFSADRVASDTLEPVVVYLPGAPLFSLKEYASVAELKQDLRINLLNPAYQQLLRSFVPKHEQAHFFQRLDEAFNLKDGSAQYDPDTYLYLRDSLIDSELFGYLQDQRLQRLKDDARDLAVPSAAADDVAKKQRLEYWESIGFNALNAAAFFVPGLGEVMAVVAAGQLVKEVIDGAHAWEAGDLDEALAHFESVAVNIALAAGLGAAGHVGPPLQASEGVDSLLRVRLPGGEERLWKPDLKPYARMVELGDIRADSKGLYHVDDKTYIRIDGHVCEVFQDAEGVWSIRHPDDPHAYQPALKHNGEGAWQAVGEQPLQWSHAQLLKRIGLATHGLSDEVLEHAVQISGIDDDVLRRMHLDNLPVPALLSETLQRFQVDRQVNRLIASLSSGQAQVEGLDVGPSLSVELPRWPARVIEVYDEVNRYRAPIRYGADRWPNGRVIRVSLQELYANTLAEKVLADLNEDEINNLLGTHVEHDKRLEVMRARVAMRAVQHRNEIFSNIYGAGRADRSLEQARLIRDFPLLTDTAALEIIGAADSAERLQLQAADGRVPMRLAEEARVYQRQFAQSRAIQGLHETTLANLDSDRLAVGLLARLPGWTDAVRIELREESLSGRMRASAGRPGGELKTLVRRGDRYAVYDALGLELSKGEDITASLLKALPDHEREALGFNIYDGQSLRTALYLLAVKDRAATAKLLGFQPIKPWFRSPLRLADGRTGYTLGGAVGTLAINRKLYGLFPELSGEELEALKTHLLLENQHLDDAIFKLEAEYTQLEKTLKEWVDASREIFQRGARTITRNRLLNAWRRKGGANRAVLRLSEQDVDVLPPLTARFDHIRSLYMNDMRLEDLPDGWLRCFPRLQALSLQGNLFGAIPPDVAALTGLNHLNLTDLRLISHDAMFDALRPLVALRSLSLQSNRLSNISQAALETLVTLPALARLNLRYNRLGLGSDQLATLARLPLQQLQLSSTGLVLDAAGAQAFSNFVHMQHLQLSDNPLGRAPELGNMVALRHLQLDLCGISEWPEGLTMLMNQEDSPLRIVNLRDNQITAVPELANTAFGAGLRANADRTYHLHMRPNPLDAESIGRLRAVGVAYVGEFVAEDPVDAAWLREETPQAQRDLWNDLFRDQANAGLHDVLGRLAVSREFQLDAPGVRQRGWAMLELAQQYTQLREDLVEIANAYPVTCGDAGADAFSALEIAVLVFRRGLKAASSNERSTDLIQMYRQLFRRQEVQRMADALSLARMLRRQALLNGRELTPLDPLDEISDELLLRENVDDVEIRLALRQKLAVPLDYLEPSSGMLYERTANLTPEMLVRVQDAVIERDTVVNRQQWMVAEPSWQRYVEKRYADQFDTALKPWSVGQEYLEYCIDEDADAKAPEILDDNVSSFLQAALGDELRDADGVLRKLELGSQLYKVAADAVAKAREEAKVALTARLTQAEEAAS